MLELQGVGPEGPADQTDGGHQDEKQHGEDDVGHDGAKHMGQPEPQTRQRLKGPGPYHGNDQEKHGQGHQFIIVPEVHYEEAQQGQGQTGVPGLVRGGGQKPGQYALFLFGFGVDDDFHGLI